MLQSDVVKYIDHTILKPDATSEQIKQLCAEAKEYGFAAVCINPVHVKQAAALLAGSKVEVCTVVGFPLGATLPHVKIYEAEQAIADGAHEVDMVINIGALKEGNEALVSQDIAGVAQVAHKHNAICKVIIETCLLTEAEKIRACQLAEQAGADFVKTSTGFSSGGATVEDVALMRRTVGPNVSVKAAGGIKTLADAEKMVAAGATRLGASAGVQIAQEAQTS